MRDVFLILLAPVALLVGGSVATWRLKLELRRDLGLIPPRFRQALVAMSAFLLLSIVSEYVYRAFGLQQNGDWRGRYGPAALALRIGAVALLYPVVEEFFFRGVLFGVIRRKAGELEAVLGSAAIFAAMHIQYSWRGMLLVLADALFFGVVRSRTRSVILTMILHVLGNSYAVWERL